MTLASWATARRAVARAFLAPTSCSGVNGRAGLGNHLRLHAMQHNVPSVPFTGAPKILYSRTPASLASIHRSGGLSPGGGFGADLASLAANGLLEKDLYCLVSLSERPHTLYVGHCRLGLFPDWAPIKCVPLPRFGFDLSPSYDSLLRSLPCRQGNARRETAVGSTKRLFNKHERFSLSQTLGQCHLWIRMAPRQVDQVSRL